MGHFIKIKDPQYILPNSDFRYGHKEIYIEVTKITSISVVLVGDKIYPDLSLEICCGFDVNLISFDDKSHLMKIMKEIQDCAMHTIKELT